MVEDQNIVSSSINKGFTFIIFYDNLNEQSEKIKRLPWQVMNDRAL